MSGPPPSRLVLLSALDTCAKGDKVRFLGCVDEYVVEDATLCLKHRYPASAPPKTARVNVRHVLESVKARELDVGSWLNVIGYVELRKEAGIFVQAVAVWDAGDVDLEAYGRAVDARNAAG
ncbi:CST complex subunit Ten1 [Clohesyomyces aquaticus]|uniref:CST complex subunit Ten1 n=1 Tax=Clohesyomyces aquaticus TaxID=1231657 RepID=A0A1Y1YYB6_9PLEO|nr:CST complex subunit Ten1 [Clohesyomyces aquaticus]